MKRKIITELGREKEIDTGKEAEQGERKCQKHGEYRTK